MTASFFREQLMQQLNVYWIGSTHCNEVTDSGAIVPKQHANMPTLELAHQGLNTNYTIRVKATLFSDGSIGDFDVVNDK